MIKEKDKIRMLAVVKGLKKLYPHSRCALLFKTPFQLISATILSAQCTDKRVNMVTKELFIRFPTAEKMSHAKVSDLEKIVRSTGFYKNKARSLFEMSNHVYKEHNGKVPETMEELIKLRGVGRKTANVVLGTAFKKNIGVVVDTHVTRLSNRMGFTKSKNPIKIEQDLMKLLPQKDWTIISHLLIDHGRAICSARKPLCNSCDLMRHCKQLGLK
jgi:endonuclease III